MTSVLARTLGRYCLLNAVILTHCALCIDHFPIIVLSIMTLCLNMGLYGSEAGYYYTAHVNFTTIFPIAIALLTIICLMVAPIFLEPEEKRKQIVTDLNDDEDEGEEEPSFELLMKQKHIRHIPDSLPAKIKKMQ